jgi:alcohol dehydrogenase class IV
VTHLFSRFRIRALGVAARLVPAPTPFMLTGPGSSVELARLIADRGVRSVLVVTDGVLVELGVVAPVLNALKEAGLAVTVFSEVEPDPTIAIVMAGIEQLRASGATAVLAVGGGSPIDAAKAMIACYAGGRRPQDLDGYFKVRGPVLPFFAVPTTAGSGSEVTVASVVSDPGAARKFAIVDNKLVPAAIALDPNLMVGLPPHVTAATGMDALTHAIESHLSTLATPATRALSVAAARAVLRDLPRAFEDGRDIAARQSLAVASCMAGLAFTRVSVGYVHAIAHQLGPLYHLPHGYLNAILLPYVLDFYVDGAASRMAELARACGLGRDGEDARSLAMSLVAAIRRLNACVGIPPTIEQIADADIPEIVQRALAEAHGTYPVPTYMSATDCATVVRRAAGRAVAAATQHRVRTVGARPENEEA